MAARHVHPHTGHSSADSLALAFEKVRERIAADARKAGPGHAGSQPELAPSIDVRQLARSNLTDDSPTGPWASSRNVLPIPSGANPIHSIASPAVNFGGPSANAGRTYLNPSTRLPNQGNYDVSPLGLAGKESTSDRTTTGNGGIGFGAIGSGSPSRGGDPSSDLATTNKLLQQLIEEMRRYRPSVMPSGSRSVYPER